MVWPLDTRRTGVGVWPGARVVVFPPTTNTSEVGATGSSVLVAVWPFATTTSSVGNAVCAESPSDKYPDPCVARTVHVVVNVGAVISGLGDTGDIDGDSGISGVGVGTMTGGIGEV